MVDADEQVVKGLDRLLTRVGLVVTGTADPARARDQILNKFFAVALLDVDTPTPGGGLELLQFVRDKSPALSVIMMTNRRSFDTAVKAFRGGAIDVVLKEPDVVPYLRERVVEAATDVKSGGEQSSILEEVSEAHELFLHKMREMSKQITDLEDRILGRSKTGERPTLGAGELTDVVVADDDPEAVPRLEKVLTLNDGWRFFAALTGGQALDHVTQQRPHIVIVKEHLPDLPGSMVLKTVKSGSPDAITLLYSPPERGAGGFVKMMEGSRIMNLVPSYTAPEQLVAPMKEIREALHQKAKERRYLQAFRQRHFEFLQRYNSLKQRVARQLEKEKK